MSKTDSLVQIEEYQNVTELRLNRPDKLNAVHDPLLEELHAALKTVSEDPESALLISGEGNVTCAGRDVDAVSQDDFERHELQSELGPLISEYPLPTAMAGKGAVIGMGFGLSLSCDFLIVGDETTLSLPEIKYDIDTSDSIEALERLVGLRTAKEIAITGEEFGGERAYELGLANEVVPEGDVDERSRQFLNNIMESDTAILRNMVETSRLADD